MLNFFNLVLPSRSSNEGVHVVLVKWVTGVLFVENSIPYVWAKFSTIAVFACIFYGIRVWAAEEFPEVVHIDGSKASGLDIYSNHTVVSIGRAI